MIIDMHLHTKKYSPCSKISLDHILNNLSPKIDGIVLTEHDVFYSRPINGFISKYEKKIFVATEITALEGDILAYGISKIPKRKLPAKDLINSIHNQKGIAIAAHPFRKYGLSDSIFDLDIDGIEINGTANSEENELAKRAATIMGLPLIGGSDVHKITQLNTYATKFFTSINTIEDIVKQIKKGNCDVIHLVKTI